MKIVFFVHCFLPSHFYGTEIYTFELARNLRELGHEVIVVSAIFPYEPKAEKVVTYYEYEGLPVYCIDKNDYPYLRIKDTYYQPEIKEILRDLVKKLGPDLVHVTHLANHTAILLEVLKELQIPAVATLTDFFGICYTSQLQAADGSLCAGPNALKTNCIACRLKEEAGYPGATKFKQSMDKPAYAFFYSLWLRALQKAPKYRTGSLAGWVLDIVCRRDLLRDLYSTYRAVIAPTRFLRNTYVRNGLKAPIREITFGVDNARTPKPIRNNDSGIRFGYIGQIAPHKGTDLLVDAFCQLPIGSAELFIYGQEDQFPDYSAGLKKRAEGFPVFFKGTFPKEKVSDVLSEMDFLAIPSIWYENSPLVLLNALASHTPVIVSDVEGLTEFVEDGKNGYIFSRGRVRDLQRVLKKIISDPARARAMSHTTEYPRTTRMMVEDVVEVYKTILSQEG